MRRQRVNEHRHEPLGIVEDRKYGINKYAVPHVGQGISISTEKDMPGFSSSGFTWNFHYAATVLKSGHDCITLESAAGWGATDWIFFMYGPESASDVRP